MIEPSGVLIADKALFWLMTPEGQTPETGGDYLNQRSSKSNFANAIEHVRCSRNGIRR